DRRNWRRAEKSGGVYDAGVARLNRNTGRRFGRCAGDCPHSFAGTGSRATRNSGSDSNMSLEVDHSRRDALPRVQDMQKHVPPILTRWLGRMNFADALELQEKVVAQKRNDPNVADTILLLEHDPVYTIGRTPDQTSLRGASHLP